MTNRLPFKFRFALTNITHNKGSAFTLLLSLGLVAMFVCMIANVFFVFKQYFYLEDRETYPTVDVVLTYDENATARLVNRRNLNTEYAESVDRALSFFNLFAVSETNSDVYYTELMSSLPFEMEELLGVDLGQMDDSSVVITESLAKSKGLDTGDQMTIYMLDRTYVYEISLVLPDTGLFAGDKVFVDKTRLLDDFFGFPFLDNLGNSVYVRLKASADPDVFITDLRADPEYSSYKIIKTVDWTEIESSARYTASVLAGLGLLVVITLITIVHSLFPIFTLKLKKQYGTILTLGGNRKFMIQVWGLELLIFFVIISLFGGLASYLVFNIAGHVYGLHAFVGISWGFTALALMGIMLFVILEGWIGFRMLKNTSPVELSRDTRYDKQRFSWYLFGGMTLLFILALILQPFSLATNSTVIIVFGIFASFQGISFLARAFAQWIRKRKRRNSFRLFNLRYLSDNRHMHHSFRVLFASFLVVMITLTVRGFILQETDRTRADFHFDYALTNIFNYDQGLETEIEANYPVDEVDPAIFYQDVYLELPENGSVHSDRFRFFVSMDHSRFQTYFGFDMTDAIDPAYLDNTIPYVILPESMSLIYGLEEGDAVSVLINREHDPVSLTIAGFFDTSFDNFMYSNLAVVPGYQEDFKINSLLILTSGQNDIFKTLIEDYGEEMYYVLDMDKMAAQIGSVFEAASDMFLVLTSVMIASFLVIIVNNSVLVFYTLKKDYARLKTIGVSKREFAINTGKEALLAVVIVMPFIVLQTFVLSEYMPNIMLYFDFYKKIVPEFTTLAIAVILVFVSFLASYSLYYAKIAKLGIIEEINIE